VDEIALAVTKVAHHLARRPKAITVQ